MKAHSRTARLAALALFTLGTAACGGGNSSPLAPTTATTTSVDPTGDATTPSGGTGWDITQVATSRAVTGATALTVSVTYFQAISAANLPPAGAYLTAATQVGTAMVFSTGTSSNSANGFTGCFGNPTFANVTYVLDPGSIVQRAADGNFSILNVATSTISGEATFAFTGPNTLQYTVPLAAVGGGSGAMQIAAIAFSGVPGATAKTTDCAPNATYIST